MKKGLIYLLLLVLGTATFSSCEDDDNDGYKRISSEYKNATLKLTFNGKELNDKTVEIQALNETTANLILKSLIPGESNLYLNALLANTGGDNYTLEAKSETTDRTVVVEGGVTEGVLTLNCTFKVTSKVVGNWKFIAQQETSTDPEQLIGKGPLHLKIVTDIDSIKLPIVLPDGSNWSFAIKDNMETEDAGFVSFAKVMFSLLVPNLLYNIELQEDGDLTATYAVMDETMNPTDTVTLPEGVVRYNVKDGEIYIAVDINALLPRSDADQPSVDVLKMLAEGLPLILKLDGDNNMTVYVDKDMMVPFMGMMDLVKGLVKDMEPMDVLIGTITAESLQKFLDDVVILVNTSETIELGLNLETNTHPEMKPQPQAFSWEKALLPFRK
ncbi:hypothetical protein CE91St19_29510 [Odoribacter laneus]|jgi:hypothetical protein|uniref:DUF4925 domain-containing protein n=1 Tax=Odoribacter laneus TaxID=626933 RepID=UPI001898E3DB|nr:DUF4925 domain-containing protein [Odoribacter laneus]GKI23549.1 hypothetical protein CE91St19_29510 [Odoribacter laneus]GKI25536.1 hypothetical protein CE91St20_16730 [Odoribacter laneus]